MKSSELLDYRRWAGIEYEPEVTTYKPLELLNYFTGENHILEIGCGSGEVAKSLLDAGHRVLGVDLNRDAIDQAAERCAAEVDAGRAEFRCGDFLEMGDLGEFDAVLLVRVFTCFPQAQNWKLLLKRVGEAIGPAGVIYINDFVMVEDSPVYGSRYLEGERRSWRRGNFSVLDGAGQLSFIAHHHTQAELSQISEGYEQLHLSKHDGVSMNGNPVRMFHFMGRRIPDRKLAQADGTFPNNALDL